MRHLKFWNLFLFHRVMASISSLSSVVLWLDATDMSTISVNSIGNDVFQWRDKTSNGWIFNPVRLQDRPIKSTNAILFNQVSSFHFISQQRIPTYSTTDIFCIITPDSLLGARQPFFDNGDVTISETDKRINTQVYADGGEFYRAAYTSNTSRSFTIYRGELYTGMDINQNPNFLQRYNSNIRSFEVFPFPISTPFIRGLGVYNGSLFAFGGGGGNAGSNDRAFRWNGSTAFISTNTVSSSVYGGICYNKEFYTATAGFVVTGSNANTRPQLYRWSSPNVNVSLDSNNVGDGRWVLASEIQPGLTGTGGSQITNNGYMVYRGDLYFVYDNNFSGMNRFNSRLGMNPSLIYGGSMYSLGVFNGNMIMGFNDGRVFRNNDNVRINFGRLNNGIPNGGGFVAYKGNLWVMKQANTVEIFFGEQGGFQSNSLFSNVTTNTVNTGMFGGFIVHDGKLFMNANSSAFVYEFGNGVTLDRPIDTVLGNAPILLQIRKSPFSCQMYINGDLVENEATNFTFSNQPARFAYVGGAAGTLCGNAYNDPGSDHFQGGVHTVVQFNTILTTSERQRVEGILAWQYGISSILSASHPFKTAPPS
jgi:hypothetical protein